MKKIMVVFGTRPEAIKMCPVVIELNKRKNVEVVVCVTGQHKEMLDTVLQVFKVVPQYNLNIMKDKQTLFDITTSVLERFKDILEIEKPDIVLVHGDTTTTFSIALSCFYKQVDVAHIEAGLRTYNMHSPYPEEFNRQVVSKIAKYHFAPTNKAKENLLNEGIDEVNIIVTGNTAIDALKYTVRADYTNELLEWVGDSKLLLLTSHRRENIGEPMERIFNAIKKIVDEYSDIKVVYPIHLNPVIRNLAYRVFKNESRIRIVNPLDVIEFHNIMKKSYIILTDSGGIQEEAPSLDIPVILLRDTTERPEGVETGSILLTGTDEDNVYNNCKKLLEDKRLYEKMSTCINPYGDGKASVRIVEMLCNL